MRDGSIEAADDAHRDDGIQIFGVPILFGCRLDAWIGQQAGGIAAHFAACLQQDHQQWPEMRFHGARIDEQSLGRAAYSRAAHLGVQHDTRRHFQIRGAVHVHVANPLEVPNHRNARLPLHPLDQLAATARHDDVDVLGHIGKHVADRRTVAGRHQLDGRRGQTGLYQSLYQALVNRRAGFAALRPCAQDHGIAGFQAQRAGIRGHVGAAFVDHSDDAERHRHAPDAHLIRALPFFQRHADRVRQSCDGFESRGHRLDAGAIEPQPLELRAAHFLGCGQTQIEFVGGQNLRLRGAQCSRSSLESGIFQVLRRKGEDLGCGARGRPQGAHQVGQRLLLDGS